MKSKVLLVTLIVLASCTRSLVYSPSLNLPAKVIKEKEIDLQGGLELLPEMRRDENSGQKAVMGGVLHIGYGFSDNFNLTAKGCADLQDKENVLRSAYTLTAQFIMPISSDERVILMPRAGLALGGSDIDGQGVGFSTVYHKAFTPNLAGYAGAGLLWGFRSLEEQLNEQNEMKLPMGFGFMATVGFSWEFTPGVRFNVETSPIYQSNTFDNTDYFLISPHIGIGYTIR